MFVVLVQVEVTDPQTGEAVNQTVLRMYWLDAHEDPVKHPGRDGGGGGGGRSNDQRKEKRLNNRMRSSLVADEI
jgi:hypothetical protein